MSADNPLDQNAIDSMLSGGEEEKSSGGDKGGGGGLAGILSQDEIDQLISGEPVGLDHSKVYRNGGGIFTDQDDIKIKLYDFRNPAFLTEVEMRQMRMKHERYVHFLAARLSMFLRMDFKLKMNKLYTLAYDKFIELLKSPTHLTLFNVDKLTGVGIIDMNTRLAMSIVNRMLGGHGHSIKNERCLTEIEIGLVEDVIEIILYEWCALWRDFDNFYPSIVGRENDGRFLQTAPHDAIMLILEIEAELGDCSELINLAFPYYMLEPIIKDIQAKSSRFNQMGNLEKEPRWMESYSDILVPMCAEWDLNYLLVKDLLKLRTGDILEIPKSTIDNTIIRLRNLPCFVGSVGVDSERVAIKIDKKVKKI